MPFCWFVSLEPERTRELASPVAFFVTRYLARLTVETPLVGSQHKVAKSTKDAASTHRHF